jgi:hypothetical protein
MVQCESRSLHPDDEQRLAASAKMLLPADIEPFVAHPCRNPNNAHAEVLTAHVKTSNGVIHWWELACQRGPTDWKCEAPVFRQFIDARLLIGGKPRRVELNFDKDTTLGRAQKLSLKALGIYADPASRLPLCAVGGRKDSGLVDMHRGNVLPVGKKPIHVSVSRSEGAESVWLEDVSVDIEFPLGTDDPASLPAACWNKILLVT